MASLDLALKAKAAQRKRTATLLPYFLVLPAFLFVFGLLLYPLSHGILLSFTNRDLLGGRPLQWSGFQNFARILALGSDFWGSVGVTVRYAAADIICELIIGLSLALLLNQEFRGRTWLRLAILLPMMIPPLSSGLMWRYMYDHSFGVIAYLFRLVGVEPPVFLADASLTLYAIVATEVWRASPFMVLVLLAALQAVPPELEEAARVDGANALQVFRYVTLPFITPVRVVGLLFRTVDALRTFDLIYMLTGGGPGQTTEVISVYIYNQGFKNFRLGFTSAAAVLLLLATLIVCAFYLRMMVRRQAEVLGE
jgi:multiple sugar transport system permease protein